MVVERDNSQSTETRQDLCGNNFHVSCTFADLRTTLGADRSNTNGWEELTAHYKNAIHGFDTDESKRFLFAMIRECPHIPPKEKNNAYCRILAILKAKAIIEAIGFTNQETPDREDAQRIVKIHCDMYLRVSKLSEETGILRKDIYAALKRAKAEGLIKYEKDGFFLHFTEVLSIHRHKRIGPPRYNKQYVQFRHILKHRQQKQKDLEQNKGINTVKKIPSMSSIKITRFKKAIDKSRSIAATLKGQAKKLRLRLKMDRKKQKTHSPNYIDQSITFREALRYLSPSELGFVTEKVFEKVKKDVEKQRDLRYNTESKITCIVSYFLKALRQCISNIRAKVKAKMSGEARHHRMHPDGTRPIYTSEEKRWHYDRKAVQAKARGDMDTYNRCLNAIKALDAKETIKAVEYSRPRREPLTEVAKKKGAEFFANMKSKLLQGAT